MRAHLADPSSLVHDPRSVYFRSATTNKGGLGEYVFFKDDPMGMIGPDIDRMVGVHNAGIS